MKTFQIISVSERWAKPSITHQINAIRPPKSHLDVCNNSTEFASRSGAARKNFKTWLLLGLRLKVSAFDVCCLLSLSFYRKIQENSRHTRRLLAVYAYICVYVCVFDMNDSTDFPATNANLTEHWVWARECLIIMIEMIECFNTVLGTPDLARKLYFFTLCN